MDCCQPTEEKKPLTIIIFSIDSPRRLFVPGLLFVNLVSRGVHGVYYKSLVSPTLRAKWKEEISTVHWPLEVRELAVDLAAIKSVMRAQAQHIITKKGGELWGQKPQEGNVLLSS